MEKGWQKALIYKRQSTLHKRLPKELKALLGIGFTTLHGKYKTSQNNWINVKLWNVNASVDYWTYMA